MAGKAICDASGFVIARDDMVRQWDGLMVANRFVDVRNPQDFVTGRRDNEALPWTRPEPDDVFLAVNEVTAASL